MKLSNQISLHVWVKRRFLSAIVLFPMQNNSRKTFPSKDLRKLFFRFLPLQNKLFSLDTNMFQSAFSNYSHIVRPPRVQSFFPGIGCREQKHEMSAKLSQENRIQGYVCVFAVCGSCSWPQSFITLQ